METTISGSVYDLGVVCKVSDVGHGTKLGKNLKMKQLIILVVPESSPGSDKSDN